MQNRQVLINPHLFEINHRLGHTTLLHISFLMKIRETTQLKIVESPGGFSKRVNPILLRSIGF
jgi:hypothetical protein